MEFGFLGLSYKKAGLDVRDKTSFTDGKKLEFFRAMEQCGIDQSMILSTCNRSEIYYFYQDESQQEAVCRLYQEAFPGVSLENYLTILSGEEAIEHLFRVAAGMESQVLGEDQILGQVRDALDFSRTMGYSKKELNKVVRDAVTCAKKIKSSLKASEIPLSVSYVGIRSLQKECGITGKKVLIVGSGKTAVLALRYVWEYGAGQVVLCSRVRAHAEEVRKEFPSVQIVQYEERYQLLKSSDIVISATSSPHLVLRRSEAGEVDREIYLLDLAMPRDIDTEFAQDENFHLINLDSLQKIVVENKRERENLVREGERIIRELLSETAAWMRTSRMDQTIGSLQQKCEEIVEDSFSYLERKLELSDHEKKLIKRTLHVSLQRMLKAPISELKQLESEKEQEQYQGMVQRLFQIPGMVDQERGRTI